MEFSYDIKIPKERLSVLIGVKGSTKKDLEDISQTKIDVDSKEGEIKITGSDSLKLYTLKDVIIAIGRGFNPDIAKILFKQDYILQIINILDFIPNRNHLERIKGRVIGANGKSRSIIEKLTNTHISVYGKTVSIIGRTDDMPDAKKGVENLLSGSPHSNVYKFLERVRSKNKREPDW